MVPACLRGKGLVALLGLIVMMSTFTIVLMASPVVAAVPIVKIVGSSTTVRPNSPIPVSATNSASIAAAKNEYEPFQVIVQAPPDDSIGGLRVDPGATITAPVGRTSQLRTYPSIENTTTMPLSAPISKGLRACGPTH